MGGLEWFGVGLSFSLNCSLTDFFQSKVIERTSSKFMKEARQPLEIQMLSIGDSIIKGKHFKCAADLPQRSGTSRGCVLFTTP